MLIKDDDIYANLYEIVIGEKIGRSNLHEFIYYNGVGLSYIDVAIGKWAYERVKECDNGTQVQLTNKSMFEAFEANKIGLNIEERVL